MTDRRGWSSGDAEPNWVPVVNPQPVFDGPSDKARWEDAMARCQRGPGEDVVSWMDRVSAAARPVGDRELPREPGEDRD